MIVTMVDGCIQVTGVQAQNSLPFAFWEYARELVQMVGPVMGMKMLYSNTLLSFSFTKGLCKLGIALGHGQEGGHHHAVHVIHTWETSNSLEADRQFMEDVLLCVNWQVVYTNSGLHHWFCQWAGHMGLSLASELDRTIHLDNLKLCTNGDSQDVRTGGVHWIWAWCVMCCW